MELKMRHGKVAVSLLIVLILGRVGFLGGAGRPSPQADQSPSAKRDCPFVRISAVTVEPKEIHQARKPNRPAAVVTVQIFHQAVTAQQTVTLNVGDFNSTPVGIHGTYSPASQTVTIPASAAGVVVAKAHVQDVQMIGANTTATLIIAASLTNPSSGVTVVDSPSPDNYRVTLTIKNP